MTTKLTYKDKDVTIYQRKDDFPLIGSGAVDYKAVSNRTGASSTGKTVGEARHNLEQGQGSKSNKR